MSTTNLQPKEIVKKLDEHIIGQAKAKRAIANAVRYRWRRMQLSQDLRNEVTPKNILMIGPTGVGKTEIARRLSQLVNAPFIKVEATKFTERGYVGGDVESIIRDLLEVAIKQTRDRLFEEISNDAETAAEEHILDILFPTSASQTTSSDPDEEPEARQILRKKLREGDLNEKEIEISLSPPPTSMEIMGPPGMEDMMSQLQTSLSQHLGSGPKQKKKMPIKEAMKALIEEESRNRVDEDKIRDIAIENVEQCGIVVIDEIDKVTAREDRHAGEVSREGVQRDLLPLVEGCTISTKYGFIKTDHILFIASGAFHLAKPSDLIPELQGRFPIRVELSALSEHDLNRILTEPKASLVEQYTALMKIEDVTLNFSNDGLEKISHFAWQVNENHENIGARRLHTVMEQLLESISFEAPEKSGTSITIDEKYVSEQLANITDDQELSDYIL